MYRILRFSISFFILLSLLTAFSCSSTPVSCGSNKDAFVDNFHKFAHDILEKQQNGTISGSNWNSYNNLFNQYLYDCNKRFEAELDSSDMESIAISAATYFYAKTEWFLAKKER